MAALRAGVLCWIAGRVLLDFVCGDVVRSTSRDIDRGTFEVGRVVFSREQRAHEWGGADVFAVEADTTFA